MKIANFEDFYRQYLQLLDTIPMPPLRNLLSDNCIYSDFNYNCKNLTYSFDNANSQDSAYINHSYLAVNCLDSDYAVESDNVYESTDSYKCQNAFFTTNCDKLTDSYFCYRCSNSNHLFGCIYLSDKSYCIFNRQYTPEQYEVKVKELLTKSMLEIWKQFDQLRDQFPVSQTHATTSRNSEYGDYVWNSVNVYMSFDCNDCHDSGYLFDSHHKHDCWDATEVVRSELSYQCFDSAELYDCSFIDWSTKCRSSSFLFNCLNLNNCFGCVNMANKQFCILNHQLTEEVYNQVVGKLKSDLKLLAPQILRW